MRKKYYIEVETFIDDTGYSGHQCVSADLVAEGDTLEELLEDAYFFYVNEDGDSIDEDSADGPEVERYITQWYYNQLAIETKQGE